MKDKELENHTDSQKLENLAKWFDIQDAQAGTKFSTEVQDDLRRIAKQLKDTETNSAHSFTEGSEQSRENKNSKIVGNPFITDDFQEGDVIEVDDKRLIINYVERKVHTAWPYKMSDDSVMTGRGFKLIRRLESKPQTEAETQEELWDDFDRIMNNTRSSLRLAEKYFTITRK